MARKGHKVVVWEDWTWRAGGVCAITIDRERGIYERSLAGRGKSGRIEGADPAARLARRYRLTAREFEVALLLSDGASNAEIATVLRISEHTARHHTRHVLLKLGLHSRARAAAVIARHLGEAAPPVP